MINKQLLFKILEIQSHSHECDAMQIFLVDYVDEKGYDVDMDDVGNIYITKGESRTYPCVVAHMDTVHPINKFGIAVAEFVGDKDIVFGMNPSTHRLTGIGGDDKCGIYAALHCLEVLPACKVAFFVDEEIGCVGSSQANMEFFTDCRFILQADRRGNDDFVHDICGPLSSKRFLKDVEPIIKKFGYKLTRGMMTDVQALRDNNVGISVANISAGYYNPHSDSEYINLRDLSTVCNMMVDLFENMSDVYQFRYIKPVYKYQSQHQHRMTSSPPPPRYNNPPPRKYEEWWANIDEKGNLKDAYGPEEEEDDDTEAMRTMEEEYYNISEIPDADVVVVSGRRKDISEMTDSEWEEFESESYQRESPVNPMLTEHRSVF